MIASLAILCAALPGGPIAQLTGTGRVHELVWKGKGLARSSESLGRVKFAAWPGSKSEFLSWVDQGQEKYAISLDGKSVAKVADASGTLHLRYREFDPLVSVPTVTPELEAPADNEWFIVQFTGQPINEFHEDIRAAGGLVYTYLADNALICRLSTVGRQQMAEKPYVRWIGAYRPAYRLDPELIKAWEAGRLHRETYSIQVSDWKGLSKKQLAQKIKMIGGEAQAPDGGAFMVATLTAEQLIQVARWNEVSFVDLNGEAGEDMDIARSVGGAVFLESLPQNYKGQGIRGEVMDGNFLNTHNDFQNPLAVLRTSTSGSSSHGSSTFGIVFGQGTANSQGKGLLPAAQGIFSSYTTLSGFGGNTSRYASTQNMLAAPNNALFQSNSWGSTQTTVYNNKSTEMDQIIFDLDCTILNSQSNTGNQNSRPEAWAKNVISIGGITHQNTATLADDVWTGASYGPAADGRIKPDICHWYDNIFTTTNTSNTAYTAGFNGTSAATPICAGFFGLWFQLWANGEFGNSVQASTAFAARPHSTLAKAWMINQAKQYAINATNTRFRQGFGLVGIKDSYDTRDNVFYVNEEDVISNLGSKVYRVYVPTGQPELKVTMTYADLPGTTSATVHRINDLSVRVTAPNGTFYWGNNGLTAGNYSTPGGASNTKDTVENVFVQNPASGVWLVEVSGDSITMDARPDVAGLNADYALVVGGVQMSSWPTASAMTYGTVRGGLVTDMKTSNNQRFLMDHPTEWNDVYNNTIRQEVVSTAPFANPTALRFRLESFNEQANVSQRIELFDYVANDWVQLDLSNLDGSDNFREVSVTSNVARFVRGADRQVKARMTWYQVIINDVDWFIGVDQARWFYTP